jgi:hypothetical protein
MDNNSAKSEDITVNIKKKDYNKIREALVNKKKLENHIALYEQALEKYKKEKKTYCDNSSQYSVFIKKSSSENEHSIFKKSNTSNNNNVVVTQPDSVKNNKNNQISQNGGNNSDKKIKSETDKQLTKKHVTIKSESEYETSDENSTPISDENSTSDDSDPDFEEETTEHTDSSTPYENTADIYRATETDDGIKKAYYKINKEMKYIEKKQNKRRITNKEVVERINFLLNGLKILNKIKKK